MGFCSLVLLLMASLFFSGGQKQVQAPIVEPELIAGPWETVSATGIDGVFLQFVTFFVRTIGEPAEHGANCRYSGLPSAR